jgi:hypothetical protein
MIDESYMERDPADTMDDLAELRLAGLWSKARSWRILGPRKMPPGNEER